MHNLCFVSTYTVQLLLINSSNNNRNITHSYHVIRRTHFSLYLPSIIIYIPYGHVISFFLQTHTVSIKQYGKFNHRHGQLKEVNRHGKRLPRWMGQYYKTNPIKILPGSVVNFFIKLQKSNFLKSTNMYKI